MFAFSLWSSIQDEKQHVNEIAIREVRSNFQDIDIFRHWMASQGGFYVPISDDIQPNPALSHLPDRNVMTKSGKQLTLMNTPYLLRKLSMDNPDKFNGHMSSLNPLNPINQADKWEAKALLSFENGMEEACEIVNYKSALHMRLIKPARFEAGCAQCHFDKPYKNGDVLGGLSVSVPMQPYYQQTNAIIENLFIAHGILWSLGIIGIAFGYRQQLDHEIKRNKNEDHLKETSIAFNNLDEGMIITDQKMNIVAVNDAFKKISGYQDHELINQNLSCLQQPIGEYRYANILELIQHNHHWKGEIQLRNKNNNEVPIYLRINPIYNNDHIISKHILVFSDISERKDFEKTLAHFAHYDHLTDLPNRLLLNDRLLQAFVQSERQQKTVAVLFLDLDNFKNINDSLGHHMGDSVLIDVTQRLKNAIRKQDTLARLGGDEFIVVMENVESNEHITILANKLIQSLATGFKLDHHEYFMGISIGISLFPKDGQTVSEMLRKADIAMYKAKENGKNNFVFYTKDIDNNFRDKVVIESELRKALENQQLVLHYQPQVSLHSQQIIGVECLVRWQHPEKGLLYPDSFIPTAESSGLMIPMGELILEQACAQMRAWLDTGIDLRMMAVNISAQQLSHPGFGQFVIDCLERCQLPSNYLELEITENYITRQDQESINNLNSLNEASIHISIDDFGTGYSSLNYLKQLPINKIKIDRSFTDGIPLDPHDKAIINAVVAIGKSLNFKVIAEGVENIEQLNFLKKVGCDEYQGYYCSKPIDANEFKIFYLDALSAEK